MSTHAVIMWAVVFCVGVPSAWRNPTAAALVLAKIAGWWWNRITGDNLPVEFYLFPDIFVMAVILAKHEHLNQRPCRSHWHHTRSILRERSPDRVVMLIFPVMWVLYALKPVFPFYVWWSLYGLVIVQFAAAGWESLAKFVVSRRKAVEPTPIIDRHLKIIPFPVQRRGADAARKTPGHSGAMLAANGGGGSG